jgi:hypothetical protein
MTVGVSLRGSSLRGRGPSLSPNRNPPASLARVRREASMAAAAASLASPAVQNPSPSLNGRIIMVGAGKSPNHGVHLNGLNPSHGVHLSGLSPSPNPNHRASLARDPKVPREASRAAAAANPASLAAQSQSPSPSPNGPRLAGESPSHGVHLNGLSPSPNPNHRASLESQVGEISLTNYREIVRMKYVASLHEFDELGN